MVFTLKVVVTAMPGNDNDLWAKPVQHRLDVARGRIDKKLHRDACGDRFEEPAAFLIEAESIVRAQAHVNDIDKRIPSFTSCSGRGYVAHKMTAWRPDQERIIDTKEFPWKRHQRMHCLRELNAHLPRLIGQSQLIPLLG